jgi:hypothetical protein
MVILSKEQIKAKDKLIKFISGGDNQFILEGFAGTGKTTVLQKIFNSNDYRHFKICFSAITNKAVSVMKKIGSEIKHYRSYKTIHKLFELYRDIQYDGSVKWKVYYSGGENRKNFEYYHIVVIDECSMINKEIYNLIQTRLKMNKCTKIIWVGDRFQLPPVKEDFSLVFDNMNEKNYYLLETIQRTNIKEIRDFQFDIREVVKNGGKIPLKKAKKTMSKEFKIIKKDEELFLNSYFQDYIQSKECIVLAYTNARVNHYNQKIRKMIKIHNHCENNTEPYIEGERIVFNNYYTNEEKIFYTSEQTEVMTIEKTSCAMISLSTILMNHYSSELGVNEINEAMGNDKKVSGNAVDNMDIVDTEKNTTMDEEDKSCPICMEKTKMMRKTKCGHMFCKECIKKWLDKNKCCPFCRMDIKDNKIYLKSSPEFNKKLEHLYALTENINFDIYKLCVEYENKKNDLYDDVDDDVDDEAIINIIRDKRTYQKTVNEIIKGIKDIKDLLFKTKGNTDVQKLILTKLWTYVYQQLKDRFADISYGYSMTVHKSQGSTYDNCYVDMCNILMANGNDKDAIRCLYTSVTRPSKSLSVLY